MKYTKLGASDLKVSRICLGSMTWGVQNTQEQAFEQMDYALAQGVNFWDTAEMYSIPPTPATYGTTESIIGNWFKARGKRDEVVMATKFSPVSWARGEANPTTNRKSLMTAVEESLKRLQTDYIDLYQLHWPTNRPNYHFANWWTFEPASGAEAKQQIIENKLETLNTLQDCIKQGKIRHIGLSDDSAWGIKQFVDLAEKHNLPRMVSIQNEYNLLRRRDDHDVAETCALEQVAYLPWSPLAMGVMSGKYLEGKFPAGTRFSKEIMGDQWDRFNTRVSLHVEEAVKAYLAVAEKYQLDSCQMAIAFTLSKSWVTSSIIGATKMDQLKSNIDAVNVELSAECLADIHKVYQDYPVAF
ncbi:aldo/keto reductase [Kiloniella laminariae]|uniref:Aldo/keto reductase n=1 Tax=Kiloniella laminariae TaxID=454162 RepID=A0ABT4LPR0_9PROT|nr:aldo/keto reductase [Kiloniella laminariae]MCZ4282301.1 aldo/keto reductase [Kiloniella laminariae]